MSDNTPHLYPLTNAQKELILDAAYLDKRGKKFANMLGFTMADRNSPDPKALNAAFNAVVRENDCMRLRIVKKGREYCQYFADYEPFELDVVNCADENALNAEISKAQDEYVDIDGGSLWRARIAVCPGAAVLIVLMHHACSDGYSQELMFDQLDKFCTAAKHGGEAGIKKIGSYVSAIEYDKKYFESDAYPEDRQWWSELYKKQRRSKYCVPTGKRATGGDTHSEHMQLGTELTEALNAFCKEKFCSRQSALMTAAAITTYRLTGKTDFCFYCLHHGRPTVPLRRVMGCLTGTVPVSFSFDENASAADTVTGCYMEYLDFMRRAKFPNAEHVPMYMAKSILNGFNFANNWMIFSAMTYDHVEQVSEYEFKYIEFGYSPSQFYLGMNDTPDSGMHIFLKYHKKLYSDAQVQSWGETLRDTVRILVEDGGRKLKDM